MTVQELARFFDHTALRPDATAEDVLRLCEEARKWGFAAACVAPCWVALAADMLKGSGVATANSAETAPVSPRALPRRRDHLPPS